MATNLDYGLIAKALGAMALGKGIQGFTKAREVGRYTDALNAGLPSGYQIAKPNRNFFFGDVSDYETALTNQAKQMRTNFENDRDLRDINSRLDPSVPKFTSLDAAKAYNSGVTIPGQKTQQERTASVNQANPLRSLIQEHPGLFFPGAGGVSTASGMGTPIMDDGTGNPVINTGASKFGGLPNLDNLSQDEIYKVIEANRQTSGENRAVAKEKREEQMQPYELKLKQLQTEKTIQEVARLKQLLQYNPQLFRARIEALQRSNRSGGGGDISKLEYLIKSGMSDEEITDWIMNGEDTSTTTITYDAKGNPKSTRVSSKSRGKGSSLPAKPKRSVNGFSW